MRKLLCTLMLISVGFPCAEAQQSSPSDIETVKAQLNRALQLLDQTQATLEATREEVNRLRTELERLQQTPSDRLSQLEEQQQVNTSRIETQDQTKVESASKYKLKIAGLVLFNAGWNRGEVNNVDVPNYVEQPVTGIPAGSIFGTFRQTIVGLEAYGPRWAGARTSAAVDFDFFGGFAPTLDGTVLGIARLRTANVQLDWNRWNLKFAQDSPFITPLNPTSLASVGTPSLGYSGNLWTWTPQIVVARQWHISDNLSSMVQIGILDPLSGEPPSSSEERVAESGERARVPAVGLRQSWTWGPRKSTVGVSGYFARHDYGFSRNLDSWAGMADWNLFLGEHFALSGELYRGQALGGLWGAVGTSAVFNGDPANPLVSARAVNTIGGWTQFKIRPSDFIEFNTAFGKDNPFSHDIRFSQLSPFQPFLSNQTVMFNVIGHPRSDLLLSLEYRHLNTLQLATPRQTGEHVNLGVGYQF
jgi:hypothetical protein